MYTNMMKLLLATKTFQKKSLTTSTQYIKNFFKKLFYQKNILLQYYFLAHIHFIINSFAKTNLVNLLYYQFVNLIVKQSFTYVHK